MTPTDRGRLFPSRPQGIYPGTSSLLSPSLPSDQGSVTWFGNGTQVVEQCSTECLSGAAQAFNTRLDVHAYTLRKEQEKTEEENRKGRDRGGEKKRLNMPSPHGVGKTIGSEVYNPPKGSNIGKATKAEDTLPTSNKEKKTNWLKEPQFPSTKQEQKGLIESDG
eukprot:710900-Pelagomonas_calceolata.AAC.2